MRIPNQPVPSDVASRWNLRHRWLAAIGLSIVPVLFTAGGSAVSQLVGTADVTAVLIIAAGAAVSALIGLAVMWRSPVTFRSYGFGAPRGLATVVWFLPPAVTILIAASTQGVHLPASQLAPYAILTAIVAVNEEIWFRGIVLAVLRSASTRTAIIGTSALFGVLHLANLAGGEQSSAAAFQVVFAVLFGVVAAQLVVLTRSLWPVILWHAVWDFVNYLGGNSTTGTALVGTEIACVVILGYLVILGYALVLRRRTAGTPGPSDAPLS